MDPADVRGTKMTEKPTEAQSSTPHPPPAPPELRGKTLSVPDRAPGAEGESRLRGPAALEPEPGRSNIDAFARHVHTYIREYIALADQKAAFIFAVVIAAL